MMNKEDNALKNLLTYITIFTTVVIIHTAVFKQLYLAENGIEASLVTAFYWTIMTMTTVGYGDIILTSPLGHLYSVLVAITGISLIFGLMFPLVVTPWLEHRIQRLQLPTKPPTNLQNHIIICGYNQLLEVLIHELTEHKKQFIILDDNEANIKMLQNKPVTAVLTQLSDENALIEAGIKKAKILIANKSDEENASIVLTARETCDVKIIALVEDLKKADYLRYAGATRVISPKTLLGTFLGRKSIYRLSEKLSDVTEVFEDLNISEFFLYPKSPLIGKTIRESGVRKKTGANIIGIWENGKLQLTPPASELIKENSVLLASGTTEQLNKLKKLTR